MPQIELKPLPPAEAVAFFRDNGFVIGFDWRDLWDSEHARALAERPVKRPGEDRPPVAPRRCLCRPRRP